jgi:hypothetical protein
MPLDESLLQEFGALRLPAVENASELTLTSLDPGRDILLALFAAAINSELGAAWTAVVDSLGASHRLNGTNPVQSTLPAEPTAAILQQVKKGFPILALHRSGTRTFSDYTLERDLKTQPWTLHYILGPLDVIDHRKVADIGVAVDATLALVIRQRRHRAYQDGALQFFDDTCAFASIALNSSEGPAAGQYGDKDSPLYLAMEMALTTTELSGYVAGSEESALEAVDLHLHLGSDEGILPDAVLWSSDAEPGNEP